MLLDAPFNQYKNVVPLRISWIQKLTRLTLLLCVLLGSPWAQADGLFDFQMKLASRGNAEAEYKVGEMYETGFGVAKDMKAARLWINKASAQGHETANFKLLYWEIESNGVKGETKNKLAELKSKADNGNAQAMYYLGKMHAYGVGVKTNYDLALDWLNKAAFVGVIEAERESLVVRNLKQNTLEKNRQAEAREQAKKESQQEKQRQQAEAKRKAEEAEQAEQLQAEARKKQQQAAQEKAYQKKISNDKQKQQAEAARQAAAQKQRQNEAAAEEKRKQALLKAQAEQKKQKEKEAQFEADPCSGKSARFLSTCR